jgi:phosphoribosylformylglycinamidine (FGAM) synthase PurS component
MPKTVEMLVGLKVPDNTSTTALQTLHNLGLKKIKLLSQLTYYKFFIEGDAEAFKKKISKVDILVNSNKHICHFGMPEVAETKIMVKNTGDNALGLLSTLQSRLGFKNIGKIERSILWAMDIDANPQESKKIAEKAAKELLVSEHYQEYKII